MKSIQKIITWDKIKVKCNFEILKILEFKLVENINEHTKIYLKGQIDEESKDKYVRKTSSEDKIEVNLIVDGKEESLFKGLISKISSKFVMGTNYIEIDGISFTSLLDVKKEYRSFQNLGMPYETMLTRLLNDYPGADIIDNLTDGKPIEKFKLLYDETVWEFNKRMASHFEGILIPARTFDKPKYYFGVSTGLEPVKINTKNYSVKTEIGDYLKANKNFNGNVMESFFTKYIVESTDILHLGKEVNFNGKVLIIKSSEIELKNNILTGLYTLVEEKGMRQNKIYNEKIKGVSIEGKIIERNGNLVKVKLEYEKEADEFCYFPYESFYTSSNNDGWYFMPEINEPIKLYFSDKEEDHGIVTNSTRRDRDSNLKAFDPSIKNLETIFKKDMVMDPTSLSFTASAGEDSNMYLRLDEENNITLESHESIDINSDNYIFFDGSEKINIKSEEGIYFINGRDGSIILDGNTDFWAKNIVDKEGYAKQIKVDPEADAEDAAIDEQILADFGAQMDKILQEIAGLNEAMEYSLEPVNLQTGNFIFDNEDIKVYGGFPIVFKRFYNSIDNHLGVLGRNWHHNYEILLKVLESDEVSITFDDGHVEFFKLENGTYAPKKGIFNKLEKTLTGYILTKEYGNKYYFNTKGQLELIKDRNGNKTILEYENNFLSLIKTDSGYLKLNYRDKKLANITDHVNRIVKYSYNGNFLTNFTNVERGIFTYEYTERGALKAFIEPRGYKFVENYFDEKYRTIKQTFPDGGKMEYNYDDENLQTILTNQDGSQVIYKRDNQYRATEIIYKDGSEKNTYNECSRLIERKDKNNNVYKFDYNEKGKLIKAIDPIGSKTELIYDEKDNLTNIKLPNGGEIESIYDEAGNLKEFHSQLMRKTKFEYDKKGNIIKTILPNEGEVEISYDAKGNISSLKNVEGNITKYEYDNLNRVKKVTDPEGNSTMFYYIITDKLSCVVNAEGKERTYEYNKCGSLIELVDFDGGITKYKYNELNKLAEVKDPRGGITKYFYNQRWNLYKIINPLGHTVNFNYDEQNRLKSVKDPEGNIINYSYDPNGNVIKISNDKGFTKFKYDELNRRIEIKDPLGAITKFSYDVMGKMTKVIDALSNVSEFSYNLEGELISAKDPLGNVTELTYNEMGLVTSVKDVKGVITNYEYHKGGNLHKIIKKDEEGNDIVETFEYNKNSLLKEYINPLGAITKYFYDALGRVTKIQNALGHEVCFKYDAMGNVISKIDEMDNVTRYNYDHVGNLIEVIDALENSTKYSYNLINQLSSIEKTNIISRELSKNTLQKIITRYNYDKRGLLLEEIDPLGNVISYEYDNTGNIISKTDKAGMKTLYEYDPVNLINKITYQDGKTVELEYNELRQLTKMKDWLGENKLELDPIGRIKKYTDYRGKELKYTWTNEGQKESVVYPDESVVNYEYDSFGRLKNVIDNEGEKTSYSYDVLGRLLEKALPNGSQTSYEYNPLNQLTKLSSSKQGEFEDEYSYKYDKLGNKIQINKYRKNLDTRDFEEGHGEYKYSYDSLNRLTKVDFDGYRHKVYEYDALGNRIFEESFQGKGYKKSYEYNELNQLLEIKTTNSGEVNYSYSPIGNLENITYNDGSYKNFTFDSFNRMTKVETSKGDNTEYIYNGFLQRVKSEINIVSQKPDMPGNKEINYILDITKPYNNLLMTEGTNIPERRFTWGHHNDLISSSSGFKDNLVECLSNSVEKITKGKLFYVQDEQFSISRLIDTNGKSQEVFSYDEFGVPNNKEKHSIDYKGFGNTIGFIGHQFEETSELWFAQGRYYDSGNGRFVSEDTHWNTQNMIYGDKNNFTPDIYAIRQSSNLYTYCMNNPIMFFDPTGLISYVIYADGTDNKKQAEVVKKQLTEKYGTETYVEYVGSAQEFVDYWNSLGNDGKDIDEVYVISHGHVAYDSKISPEENKKKYGDAYGNGYLQFGNGSEEYPHSVLFSKNFKNKGDNNRSIDDIIPKKMKELYFSACNTANSDFNSNIAQAFYDKNPNINTVSGWDGGVGFVFQETPNKLLFWQKVDVNKDGPSPESQNPTFKYFRKWGKNPKRERPSEAIVMKH